MLDLSNIDQKLMDLMYFALDHGIESVKDGKPLIPFAVAETNGKKTFNRFIPKDFSEMEETLKKAEDYLKKLDPTPDFVAIAFEALVTLQDKKTDAIMVKGFDTTQDQGYLFAQRFKPKSFLKKFTTIGNAGYFGNEPNPIKK